MPKLSPNARAIQKAMRGHPMVYAVEKHPGLYLAVLGEGRGSWRIRYRPRPGAIQRWFTLTSDAKNADFAEVSRKAAQLLSRLRLEGADPHDEKDRRVGAGKAYGECFHEWLDHTGRQRKRALAPRTRQEYARVYRLHIRPYIGTVAIAELNKAQIEDALRKVVEATNDAAKRQRGLQATKAFKIIYAVCAWALDRGHIDRNPARGIDWLPPDLNPNGKQTRTLSNEELRELWHEAPAVMTPAQVRVLRLTILIGRRISEIAAANRSDVRLSQDVPCLWIPASREGNKAKRDDAVPLPPAAASIIKEALAVGEMGEPLFVGAATRWATSKAFTAFSRAKNWPGRTRLHDLRGLINDQMSMMGIPSEIRSRTLHHTGDLHTGDLRQLVNTTYSAFDFMDLRLRALQLWEDRLFEIVEGRPPSSIRW